MNLEYDLYLEPFLKEHEKNPSYKQAYDFKTKMFGSLKAQRTSLVPLFKLLDRLVEVKQKVDDTLDMSKAVIAPVSYLGVAHNPGWGEENVLYLKSFLMGHEQTPSYKLVYDLKTKMFGSLKAQITSLVPLFMWLDRQGRGSKGGWNSGYE